MHCGQQYGQGSLFRVESQHPALGAGAADSYLGTELSVDAEFYHSILRFQAAIRHSAEVVVLHYPALSRLIVRDEYSCRFGGIEHTKHPY